MRTVGVLVRAGSLAAAAAELGINYTTVARRVQRAEAALGEPLFERLADGYKPNDTARLVASHAARMEAAEHALMRQIAGRDERLTGSLTFTAPQLLITHVLGEPIAAFSKAHPEVELHIRASNEVLDLTRREADVALRISRAPGDTLKGLRLTEQHAASFATQDWATRIKADPKGPIDWIVYDQLPNLPSLVTEPYPGSAVRYRFDDMGAMIGAAQAGLGVVRTPMFVGRSTPGLVQVPVLPPQPYADIWIVGHADVWPGAKVTALRDVLVPHIRNNRALFVA